MTRRHAAAALLFVLSGLAAVPVAAEEAELLLELVLNGRNTGQIGDFVERDGQVMAKPGELRDLGFVLPPGKEDSAEPIPLSTLPGVRVRINRRRQTLEVTAESTALAPTELQAGGGMPRLRPLSPAGWGAVLNYDALGTFMMSGANNGSGNTGGALLETRGLTPYGVLSSSELYQINSSQSASSPGPAEFVRLDTTYTYSQPDDARRWRVGDVISGALTWTRSVRLGGAQVATDFGMRPDLITYPLPQFSGSAVVPSTVDMMVNGNRTFSEQVEPGPFQVRNLPSVNGAGEVVVEVTDALGRQVLTTVPFYVTPKLLKEGLASYSLEAGSVRNGYGAVSDLYSGAAGNASVRYGVTDWLTLEAHSEGSTGLALAGAGAAVRVGTLGVIGPTRMAYERMIQIVDITSRLVGSALSAR